MLLAYTHWCNPKAEVPDLCLIPEKPDQFSVPVKVDYVGVTDAAIYRLGPVEAFLATKDPNDKAIIIEPVKPAKLFVTPDLHDQPGVMVRRLKIIKKHEHIYETYYLQERHKDDDWQAWEPLKRRQ